MPVFPAEGQNYVGGHIDRHQALNEIAVYLANEAKAELDVGAPSRLKAPVPDDVSERAEGEA